MIATRADRLASCCGRLWTAASHVHATDFGHQSADVEQAEVETRSDLLIDQMDLC